MLRFLTHVFFAFLVFVTPALAGEPVAEEPNGGGEPTGEKPGNKEKLQPWEIEVLINMELLQNLELLENLEVVDDLPVFGVGEE